MSTTANKLRQTSTGQGLMLGFCRTAVAPRRSLRALFEQGHSHHAAVTSERGRRRGEERGGREKERETRALDSGYGMTGRQGKNLHDRPCPGGAGKGETAETPRIKLVPKPVRGRVGHAPTLLVYACTGHAAARPSCSKTLSGSSAPSAAKPVGRHGAPQKGGKPLGGAGPGRERKAWALAFREVGRAAGFMTSKVWTKSIPAPPSSGRWSLIALRSVGGQLG